MTQEQLEEHAAAIKSQFESGWSGTLVKDGITYTVSAQVSVSVTTESEAIDRGNKGKVDNIVAVVAGDSFKEIKTGTEAGAQVHGNSNEQFDRMMVAVGALSSVPDVYRHEATHVLGV